MNDAHRYIVRKRDGLWELVLRVGTRLIQTGVTGYTSDDVYGELELRLAGRV